MKKELVFWCMVLVVLTGCTAGQWKNKEYSFAEGFSDLAVLDKEFNASFKEEQLFRRVVALEDIGPLLEKLDEMKKNVELVKETPEKEVLLKFIEIRKIMLLSEKNFQLAQRIGDIGLVMDRGGFKCSEAKYILDASFYYNESFTLARKARFDLDSLLYDYRDVSQVQELVGLDENKTAFYKSPLDQISKILRLNQEGLEKNCKIRVVTN